MAGFITSATTARRVRSPDRSAPTRSGCDLQRVIKNGFYSKKNINKELLKREGARPVATPGFRSYLCLHGALRVVCSGHLLLLVVPFWPLQRWDRSASRAAAPFAFWFCRLRRDRRMAERDLRSGTLVPSGEWDAGATW